jgi:hypothetical protein
MTRFQIYTTGGDLVRTFIGPAIDDCEIINRLGVSPPWQIVYVNGRNRELICKFSAKHRKPGVATRPNNYYARFIAANNGDGIFSELSQAIDHLFSGEYEAVGEGTAGESWSPTSEGEANSRWLRDLATEQSVSTEHRADAETVEYHIRNNGPRLLLGFSGINIVYALLHKVARANATAVLGKPAKQNEFTDVELLLDITESHSDFDPLDRVSQTRMTASRKAYQEHIIKGILDQLEVEIDGYASQRADTSAGSMEVLQVLRGLMIESRHSNESDTVDDATARTEVERLNRVIDEKLSDTTVTRSYDELSTGIIQICSSRVDRVQKRLAEQTVEYIADQIDDLKQEHTGSGQVSATLAIVKKSHLSGQRQQHKTALDSAVQNMLSIRKAKEYLNDEQWEAVSNRIVTAIDQELKQLNTQDVDAAVERIESNVDELVTGIASTSEFSEPDVRALLAQRVTIASSKTLAISSTYPLSRRITTQPFRLATWKYVALASIRSRLRIIFTVILLLVVAAGTILLLEPPSLLSQYLPTI